MVQLTGTSDLGIEERVLHYFELRESLQEYSAILRYLVSLRCSAILRYSDILRYLDILRYSAILRSSDILRCSDILRYSAILRC